MTMEGKLEAKLTEWAKAKGGIALKGATQFDTGYPDRIVYIPGAHAHVELKGTSTRYHLNEKQKLWAGRIIASKSPYYIVENETQLLMLYDDIYNNPAPLSVNAYRLNGFQLVLYVNEITGTYEVLSERTIPTKKILHGAMIDTLDKMIYRIFVSLETIYPKTNYCDM